MAIGGAFGDVGPVMTRVTGITEHFSATGNSNNDRGAD
jgi:hypothetical protein